MKNQGRQLAREEISRYFREGNRLIERTVTAEARVYPDVNWTRRFEAFISRLKRNGLRSVAEYFERAYNEAAERAERYYNRPRYRMELTGELLSIADLDREYLNASPCIY